MSFEVDDTWVVQPINRYQGHRYTELTKDVIDGSMVYTIDNLSEGMTI